MKCALAQLDGFAWNLLRSCCLYVCLWQLGHQGRAGSRMSTATNGWNYLHPPWAFSRWLHLLYFVALLCTDHNIHVQWHTCQAASESFSAGKHACKGHRLFETRFCCAIYAPVIHLWVRLTSFKSLSSGPARTFTLLRKTVGIRSISDWWCTRLDMQWLVLKHMRHHHIRQVDCTCTTRAHNRLALTREGLGGSTHRQWAWHGATYCGEVTQVSLSLVLHILGTLSDLSIGTTEAFQLNDISVNDSSF